MPGLDTGRRADDIAGRMREGGGLLVAYSGGLDSSVVASLARRALGDRAVAVMVESATVPGREVAGAAEVARHMGIRLFTVTHDELGDPGVSANGPDRCYHCRKGMVGLLMSKAQELGLPRVADGVVSSDRLEHRPGIRAADEAGVWHPLEEAGLDKNGVRELARHLDLPVSEKPSQACMASRVPYGTPITRRMMEQVEKGEDLILSLGFTQVRVRHYGELAKVEVPREETYRLMEDDVRDRVEAGLRECGFLRVAVDLRGYRSGAMDEALTQEQKREAMG